jgi:drug/metabolite transporter (DMT)-like permease
MLAFSRLPMVSPIKNKAMLWAGVLDVIGNILYILARQHIRLDITAVLASLYPAATILWARVILKEKTNLYQKIGIGLSMAGIVLITI